MIAVKMIEENDWRLFRALRQEALREAPHAFRTTLSEWQGTADTENRWRNRLTAVPFNIVALLSEVPSGMVSATAPDVHGTVELISMWVAPTARGRGVGDTLVQAVLRWANEQHAVCVTLEVTEGNETAAALYHRNGFRSDGAVTCGGKPSRRMVRVAPLIV